MQRVLLLATTTGYQTRAFEKASADLDVELSYATDRCHLLDDPWRDDAIPVRFHDEEASVAAIVASARSRPVAGILAVGDRPTVVAARAAAALGLPGHPVEAAAAARNKLRTRERLRDAGLAVPQFVAAALKSDARALAHAVGYPCVIKPLALSASRGVMRADDPEGLLGAFERLRRLMSSPDVRSERSADHEWAIVERFIPGREYAVEGVLHHGALQVLAIFDKPDPLDGPFFEETIYLTPSRASGDEQALIVQSVGQAAAAIGLHHGPIHAECRLNSDGVFVLEVAARPIGGLCARALRFEKRGRESFSAEHAENDSRPLFQSPIPLENLLLRSALGESLGAWRREALASGVMMIPIPQRGLFRRVAGVEAAREVPGVDDVVITAKEDQVLVPLPEGASYLGFIFAHGESAAEADVRLREAHACLRFTIDAEIPLARC